MWCNSPTAALNESGLGEVATFSGRAIPLDKSQRKEGILTGILASVNLSECHEVAISGYPISGLDVIGKGHGHDAVYYNVKETETDH